MFFRNVGEILSRPLALLGFSPFNSLKTPSLVILISSICLKGLSPFEGAGWGSSLVKTEEYCWFRISAFPFASDTRVPFLRNGATPQESFFLDLTKDQKRFSTDALLLGVVLDPLSRSKMESM